MNIKIFLKVFVITTAILITAYNAQSSYIRFNTNHITNSITSDSSKLLQLEQRVWEIQNMNLSTLSPGEKKNLNHELKQLLKEAKTYNMAAQVMGSGRGVYISVGALIIIILLLILILH